MSVSVSGSRSSSIRLEAGGFETIDFPSDGSLGIAFSDGATYEGDFKNDQMHGEGKYTFVDGEIYHNGKWENGAPVVVDT